MLLRALLTAGVVALAAPAFAQTNPQATGGQSIMQACGPDIQNFCSGVQPGGGRIISCLHPHMRQLSSQCKGQVAGAYSRFQQRQQQQQQQPQP